MLYIMLSDWNKFVQKVYREGKAKNPEYKFKNALVDASKQRKRGKKGGNAEASPLPTVSEVPAVVPGAVESSAANTAAPFKGGKSRKAGKKNKGTRKNKAK